MCVIGRSFGLRNMVRLGMNVVLMRDLTDTMYDAKSFPYVSHFSGNSLIHEYIEKFVCPTIVSSDFTGKKQFRFNHDKRPVIAFIAAEGEYRANQRLPEFAHELLLTKNVNCEFALGKQPNGDVTQGHNRATLVHLGNIAYRSGNQQLFFDRENERFINNNKANELIKPSYREPYIIPENV